MGDFLSVPNKDKESEDNENNEVCNKFFQNIKTYENFILSKPCPRNLNRFR
jgi:hypothetical protein